jgi:hypothetical protein
MKRAGTRLIESCESSPARSEWFRSEIKIMQDILWIAVTIAFFAVAVAYVHFCERVK